MPLVFKILTDIRELECIDENIFIYAQKCLNILKYNDYKIYYGEIDNIKYIISLHFRIGTKISDKKYVIDFRNPENNDERILFSYMRADMKIDDWGKLPDQVMIDYFKFFSNGDLEEEEKIIANNVKPELIVVYLHHNHSDIADINTFFINGRYSKLIEKIANDPSSALAYSKYILKNNRFYAAEPKLKENIDIWNLYKLQCNWVE